MPRQDHVEDGARGREPTNSTGMHGLPSHYSNKQQRAVTGAVEEAPSSKQRGLNHCLKKPPAACTQRTYSYYSSLYTAWQAVVRTLLSAHTAVARFLKFLVDAKYTSRRRLDATPQQSWGTFPSIPVLDPTSSSKRCNGICDNSEAVKQYKPKRSRFFTLEPKGAARSHALYMP